MVFSKGALSGPRRPPSPPLRTLLFVAFASLGSGAMRGTEALAAEAGEPPSPNSRFHQAPIPILLPPSACSGPEFGRAEKGRAVFPLQGQSRNKPLRVGT